MSDLPKKLPKLIDKDMIYKVVPKKVIKKLKEQFFLDFESEMHGFSHWCRVLENGLIISSINGANKNVIIAFSLFHDLCRLTENREDIEHGLRASIVLEDFKDQINLTEEEFLTVVEACKNHSNAMKTDNKDIGTCWDADRLDLLRVGIYPDKKYLSTSIGNDSGLIVVCNSKSINSVLPDWAEDIFMEL